jgi:hypothetical protein
LESDVAQLVEFANFDDNAKDISLFEYQILWRIGLVPRSPLAAGKPLEAIQPFLAEWNLLSESSMKLEGWLPLPFI